MSDVDLPRIAVCVPTYRRPQMLEACLGALVVQERAGFDYSIVVVDNDAAQSAREVVERCGGRTSVAIAYAVEATQNISLARNRAVAASRCDYIAFIDDDECADADWLKCLYSTCRELGVDGVLGPVLPRFEGTPPGWLVESGLCLRTSFPTGTPLTSSRYMRTGNVLFARAIVGNVETPFDPQLGRSGGEDADFFDRMLAAGRSFAWCNEARVHEWIPADRQTLRYHLRRAVMRGVTEADKRDLLSLGTAKSIVAIVAYAIALPFLLVVRFPLFAKYLVRCCDHAAKLLAQCGVKLARERSF